jgi:hypothetical protein
MQKQITPGKLGAIQIEYTESVIQFRGHSYSKCFIRYSAPLTDADVNEMHCSRDN